MNIFKAGAPMKARWEPDYPARNKIKQVKVRLCYGLTSRTHRLEADPLAPSCSKSRHLRNRHS